MKETCLNCKRYTDNGGQCYGDHKFHTSPCLAYIRNELGERLYKTFNLEVKAGNPLKEGDIYKSVGIDVAVVRIKKITWNMNKLCLEVEAGCMCWSEQYSRLKQKKHKVTLTVIKGKKV